MNRNFLLLIYLFIHSLVSAQDLFDLEHTKSYASYLYQTRQYNLAILELERVVIMENNNDSIKTVLLDLYTMADRYEDGLKRAILLFPDLTIVPTNTADIYLSILIKTQRWVLADSFVKVNHMISDQRRKIYEVCLAFNKYDLNYINHFYQYCDTARYPDLNIYGSIIGDPSQYKLKKPYLGALYSIVPGVGKFYARDYKDGIASLLYVSLSAFQTYRGFAKRGTHSVYGYIYGGLTLAFYAGNIFGGYKSTKRYNKELKVELAHRANQISSQLLR
ncbi:MAG: hypothetical protein HYZ42_04535 [Bacteroidetes bacterium]|nr:hypothetical protein [Bacteroidota bacterium]